MEPTPDPATARKVHIAGLTWASGREAWKRDEDVEHLTKTVRPNNFSKECYISGTILHIPYPISTFLDQH